ncbi:MAG TPA: serine hydrolase domain-containing protein [Vicinamibacterales bacterium]|nr:serine hydrolase domain-containing protein [Vicinamibacterales bacterium]
MSFLAGRLAVAGVFVSLLATPVVTTPPPTPLPLGSAELLGFSPDRLARLHRRLREFVDEGRHAGIVSLIARNGQIVDWQAWGTRDRDAKLPMEKDTIVRVYSMSKIVTSAAVMQLHEQALLRLDDPVEKYLPALAKRQVLTGGTAKAPVLVAAKRSVTIKDLLTHTSGYVYPFMFTKGALDEIYQAEAVDGAQTMGEFVERVARVPLAHEPGARFTYGMSTDLLGAVIEKVSGRSLEAYIAEHITGPLQMVDTGFHVPLSKRARVAKVYTTGKDGALAAVPDADLVMSSIETARMHWGGAGLFSTVGDYARFGQMLLDGGALDGVRVLGRKSVELMMANALTHTPTPNTAFSVADGFGYGGAVRLDLAKANRLGSPGQFGWTGAASTYFNIDPQERTVALVFTQHFPHDQHQLFWTFSTLFYASLVE